MSKLPGRIPFEDVEKFRNWAVPKVNGQVLASAEREAKKAQMANMPKQEHETVEEISAEQVSLGPMTAEQLAQITDEATADFLLPVLSFYVITVLPLSDDSFEVKWRSSVSQDSKELFYYDF